MITATSMRGISPPKPMPKNKVLSKSALRIENHLVIHRLYIDANIAAEATGAPADAPLFSPRRDIPHPDAFNVVGVEPPELANAAGL